MGCWLGDDLGGEMCVCPREPPELGGEVVSGSVALGTITGDPSRNWRNGTKTRGPCITRPSGSAGSSLRMEDVYAMLVDCGDMCIVIV